MGSEQIHANYDIKVLGVCRIIETSSLKSSIELGTMLTEPGEGTWLGQLNQAN